MSQVLILIAFMFSFVLAMSAAFLAAPAIASDVETGTVHAMLARPLRRAELVVGRWLGLSIVVAGYAADLGPARDRRRRARQRPRPAGSRWSRSAFLAFQAVAVLTLALALGTRLPSIAAGAITVVLFGLGWFAGVLGNIAVAFEAAPLQRLGEVVRVLIPTDGLWRGVIYGLEPPVVLLAAAPRARGDARQPVLRRRAAAGRVHRLGRRLGRARARWPGSRCSAAASSEPARPRVRRRGSAARRTGSSGSGSAAATACGRCRPSGRRRPRPSSLPADPYSTTWYRRPDTPRRRRSSRVRSPTAVRASVANIGDSWRAGEARRRPRVVRRGGVVRRARPGDGRRCPGGSATVGARGAARRHEHVLVVLGRRRRRSRRRTP